LLRIQAKKFDFRLTILPANYNWRKSAEKTSNVYHLFKIVVGYPQY